MVNKGLKVFKVIAFWIEILWNASNKRIFENHKIRNQFIKSHGNTSNIASLLESKLKKYEIIKKIKEHIILLKNNIVAELTSFLIFWIT